MARKGKYKPLPDKERNNHEQEYNLPQESSFSPLLKCLKHTDHIALIIELLGKVPRKLIVAGKYSKEFFTKKGKINVFVPSH